MNPVHVDVHKEKNHLKHFSKQLLCWLYCKNVGNEAHDDHSGQNRKNNFQSVYQDTPILS